VPKWYNWQKCQEEEEEEAAAAAAEEEVEVQCSAASSIPNTMPVIDCCPTFHQR